MRKLNYLVILFITALIFLTGIWVGDRIADFRVDSIVKLQQEVGVNSAAIGLQRELLKDGICDANIFDITEDRFQLGRKIANLEGQVGFGDETVLRLKNDYSILNIQQYLLVKEKNEKCGVEINPILFFYDNIDAKEDSQAQGYILDYVYKTHPKEVIIYSFDVHVENPAVSTLIDLYNIDKDSAPSIVINGEVYEDVLTSKEIFNVLGIVA